MRLILGVLAAGCSGVGGIAGGGSRGAEPETPEEQGVDVRLGFTARGTGTSQKSSNTTTADTATTDTGTNGATTTGPIELVFTDRSGATVSLDGAWAVVRHIEIDLPSGTRCDDLDPSFVFEEPVRCEAGEDKIEIGGPLDIDLVNQRSTPSLTGLTIPPGTYRRVDVRLHDSSAPSEITFIVVGTVHDPVAPVDFELALGINEDARFESPDGIVLKSSDEMLARLDLDAVLGQTRLGACARELEHDGYAQIDGESDCGDDLEDTIEDALKDTFDLD